MRNPDRETVFHFKQFSVRNSVSAMKVGTDAVLLGAWAGGEADGEMVRNILDVGCGTGVVALMLAQRFGEATVTGVEIEAGAAGEGAENFAASPWRERLAVVEMDFAAYAAVAGEGTVDLMVCNPPYFTETLRAPEEQRAMARHQGALTYAALMRGGARLLAEGGGLALVAPEEHAERILQEGELAGLAPRRVCHVKTVERKAPKRVLVELRKGYTGAPEVRTLTMHGADGSVSAEYETLVENFYRRVH